MKIKDAIYKELTPRQRIISMIEAIGRADAEEVERLKETCERKSYRISDLKYYGVLTRLFEMSMAVESDLRGMVINYIDADSNKKQVMFAQEMDNNDFEWNDFFKSMGIKKQPMTSVIESLQELQDMYIQKIANIDCAWNELLESMGINKVSIGSAFAPRHEQVIFLLKTAPPPDKTDTKEMLGGMKEYINA